MDFLNEVGLIEHLAIKVSSQLIIGMNFTVFRDTIRIE